MSKAAGVKVGVPVEAVLPPVAVTLGLAVEVVDGVGVKVGL
jgi:hypothetical protein